MHIFIYLHYIYLLGNYTGIVVSRSVPEGVNQWEFEYPFVEFKVHGYSLKCTERHCIIFKV